MNDTHTDFENTKQSIGAQTPSAGRCCGAPDQHIQWLSDWRAVRSAGETVRDNSPNEVATMEAEQSLSVLIATTPAMSPDGLVAQIEWFKEDLGGYVLGNASPAHDLILETPVESVVNLRD